MKPAVFERTIKQTVSSGSVTQAGFWKDFEVKFTVEDRDNCVCVQWVKGEFRLDGKVVSVSNPTTFYGDDPSPPLFIPVWAIDSRNVGDVEANHREHVRKEWLIAYDAPGIKLVEDLPSGTELYADLHFKTNLYDRGRFSGGKVGASQFKGPDVASADPIGRVELFDYWTYP